MNAKELMLNDLVLFDNRVCKIVATNAYRDCVELIDISDNDNEVVGRYAKHIEPLMITSEMLKLNGFIRHKDDYVDLHNGVFVRLAESLVGIVSEMDGINTYYIDYVHELQHALRSCGRCEFADNFKVK